MTMIDFYAQRVAECSADAAGTSLEQVGDRALRAQASWQSCSTRKSATSRSGRRQPLRNWPMAEREPDLLVSSLSRQVIWNGHKLQLEIYRLDTQTEWTLEVVNEAGTSTVWDDLFPSDDDAEAEFRATFKKDGIAAFF